MQIDQVLQWLAENTGKSVVKHPSAHCQVTIVSTKKVTRQEAVTMVYRALGMEGFTAIETRHLHPHRSGGPGDENESHSRIDGGDARRPFPEAASGWSKFFPSSTSPPPI